MNNNDIIIDVIGELDHRYIKSHIRRVQPTAVDKFVKYASAVAIYTLVCVSLFIVVPHIINTSGDDPGGVAPGESIITETNVPPSSDDTTNMNDPIGETTITLNTDLFDEYMMTYAELSEKHGKLVDFAEFDGGRGFYKFENGYGYYLFYTSYGWGDMTTHPEGGFKYIPCNEDAVCRGIRPISPKNLFNEDFETLSIEAISNIEGVNLISTDEDGIVTPRAYASNFTYDGWNNDKVELFIYHEYEDMIDLTSEARIYIHPSYIEEYFYQSILDNNIVMYDTSTGENVYLSDYLNNARLSMSEYSILDLNGDDRFEMVIRLGRETNEYWGFLILHKDEDVVYAYELSYRAFNDLKKDGTFMYSAGVSDYGIGKIDFSDDTYTINTIAYCKTVDGTQEITYSIENRSVSKEEFDAYIAEHGEKVSANWYEIK